MRASIFLEATSESQSGKNSRLYCSAVALPNVGEASVAATTFPPRRRVLMRSICVFPMAPVPAMPMRRSADMMLPFGLFEKRERCNRFFIFYFEPQRAQRTQRTTTATTNIFKSIL